MARKKQLAVNNGRATVALDSIAGYTLSENGIDGTWTIRFCLKSGDKMSMIFYAKQLRLKVIEFVDEHLATQSFGYHCHDACAHFEPYEGDHEACEREGSECINANMFEFPKENEAAIIGGGVT